MMINNLPKQKKECLLDRQFLFVLFIKILLNCGSLKTQLLGKMFKVIDVSGGVTTDLT